MRSSKGEGGADGSSGTDGALPGSEDNDTRINRGFSRLHAPESITALPCFADGSLRLGRFAGDESSENDAISLAV